jgi:hypothetical protein
MNKELIEKLDSIELKIESRNIVKEANSIMEWAGSDVIISSQLNDGIKEWFGDQFAVITLEKTEPRRKAVITEFSKELSWLFYQLKDIFAGELNYISKPVFFGMLAQTSIDYLEKNKEDVKCDQLLFSVLDKARSFSNE